jgi:histone H3/H4
VAALRTFALVDHEAIVDERDGSITTGAIRLRRLVREVGAARRQGKARDQLRRALAAALATVYPNDGYKNPASWPRCAPLTPHLLKICETEMADAAANAECAELLNRASTYFLGRAAYSEARPLLERALAIREKLVGGQHPGIPKIADSTTWTRPKQKSCLSARSSPGPVNISHRHRAEVNMEPVLARLPVAAKAEVRLQAAAANSINERQEALTMKISREAQLATIVQQSGQLPWAK